MTVLPHLGILTHPLAFLVELCGAIGLVIFATRLEHERETDETPRIIRPYSEPERPKRHWFWLKIAFGAVTCSALVAIGLGLWVRHTQSKQSEVAKKESAPAQPAPPQSIPVPQLKSSAKSDRKTKDGESKQPTVAQPTAASGVKLTGPIIISVPDRPATPKPPARDQPEPIATIGELTVKASEKPSGTLYATAQFIPHHVYRGTFNTKSLETAKTILERTGKMTVFLGSYQVGISPGTRRGVGPLGQQPTTIYYFDKALSDACASVEKILTAEFGTFECVLREWTPPPFNPRNPNPIEDFYRTTGLDMEIIF